MCTVLGVTKFMAFEDLGKLANINVRGAITQFEDDHQLHGGAVEQLRRRVAKLKVCEDVVLLWVPVAHHFATLL